MSGKLTNEEIVNIILEEDIVNIREDEEIIHLLLDKKVAKNINITHNAGFSLGDRVSDKMADVAGSWAFILTFIGILTVWIIGNIILLNKPFDPFPFILLNLVLSCIAALQAPVIMMSQNRQETKDRIRSENDYKVNLKAELIIEDLHSKIDKLILSNELLIEKINSLEGKKNL